MRDEDIFAVALTGDEVAARVSEGKVNTNSDAKSKSVGRIILDNCVSLFNILNLFFVVLLITVGSYKDTLFVGVVLCNTIIGIVQEIRSKIAVDRLSIVVSSTIPVIRDGEVKNIDAQQIVLDDVIILRSGAQIPCDCEVLKGFCYANESLLTGESDLIEKQAGSTLLSGSFVTSGEVYAKVKRVGADSYASKILAEAKVKKKINSEIMRTLNRIITYCSIALFPIGIALFVNGFFFNGFTLKATVTSTVAALVAMIPQGLILLTSTVLCVAVIRLSRRNVLVQQLFCIETLARVDVLCLDKTGTITTGEMEVVEIININETAESNRAALKSIAVCALDKNSTLNAIDGYINTDYMKAEKVIPFASEKKWSGATLSDGRSYVLGAAECVFDYNSNKELFGRISLVDDKYRVVTLSVSGSGFDERGNLPEGLVPLALVVIKDKIRDNASDTVRYFTEEGVQLKVISGDSNKTVERIATMVGVPNAEKSVDASTLDTDEKIAEAADKYSVFGRVTPDMKKKLVIALKNSGHTVAMTGDGVNDVLALREADCSIAVASGSDAAKHIAQLVLTDDDFSHMPEVVAEGRRSINNIQRSAALFITKTIYSIILGFAFIFIPYIFHGVNYPFTPIQMSLLNGLVIGLPSFVLALQPDKNRIRGKFHRNIVSRSWPGSVMVILNIFTLVLLSDKVAGNYSTLAAILVGLVGVLTIIRLSLPLNPLRTALLIFTVAGLFVGVVPLGWFFDFTALSGFSLILLAIMAAATALLYNILYSVSMRFNREYNNDIKG